MNETIEIRSPAQLQEEEDLTALREAHIAEDTQTKIIELLTMIEENTRKV